MQATHDACAFKRFGSAIFLAQCQFGAGGGAGAFFVVVLRLWGDERVAVVIFEVAFTGAGLGRAGTGSVADRRTFDQPLVQTEFAVIADRDDNAGAGAILGAVDREAVDRLSVELVFSTSTWQLPQLLANAASAPRVSEAPNANVGR